MTDSLKGDEAIGYHAEQAWTYMAQASATDKQVASARYHINKIRAAISVIGE